MRGQTLTSKPLSPGTLLPVKSRPEQHLCHLPSDLTLLFLECAGVNHSQGKTSAVLRCLRTRLCCPHTTAHVHQRPNRRRQRVHRNTLRMEAVTCLDSSVTVFRQSEQRVDISNLPTSPKDQVRQPSLYVGQAGQDGHMRAPRLLRLFPPGHYDPCAAGLLTDQCFHLLCG